MQTSSARNGVRETSSLPRCYLRYMLFKDCVAIKYVHQLPPLGCRGNKGTKLIVIVIYLSCNSGKWVRVVLVERLMSHLNILNEFRA